MDARTLNALFCLLLAFAIVVGCSSANAKEVEVEAENVVDIIQKEHEKSNRLWEGNRIQPAPKSTSQLDEVTYYLDETFDSGIPEDWSTVANDGTSVLWGILNDVNYGSNASFINDTPPIAGIDSDEEGDVDINADLLTPEITIPVNPYTSLFIQFDASFRTYHEDAMSFYYTIDGGNSWIELYHLNTQDSGDYSTHYYDLLPIIGNVGGTIQFKWKYVADYGYHMAIDNVVILGTDEDIFPPAITLWIIHPVLFKVVMAISL